MKIIKAKDNKKRKFRGLFRRLMVKTGRGFMGKPWEFDMIPGETWTITNIEGGEIRGSYKTKEYRRGLLIDIIKYKDEADDA